MNNMTKTKSEAARYGVVGVACVLLDFITYRALALAGFSSIVGKMSGCVVSSVASYFLNRAWTFRVTSSSNRLFEIGGFAAVYITSIIANVAINEAILIMFGRGEVVVVSAFLVATLVSAAYNFFGMKFAIFRK